MKKSILILAIIGVFGLTGIASATLWDYFGGELPSLAYRAKIYKQIVQDKYYGTASQNIALESYLTGIKRDTFGAVKPFRPSGFETTLASSLAEGGSETTLKVNSLTLPDGTSLASSSYGDLLILTVGEGDDEEKIAVGDLNSTTKTFTIISRGLEYGRWASTTDNMHQHLPGERVFVSDDDHWIYQQLPDLESTETIPGQKTFTLSPIVPTPSSSNLTYAANVEYVNDVATSGAANASETIKGIGELATKAEAAAGTSAGGTSARLLLPASMATTTPTATTSVPVTNASGKLSQSFLDLTASFTFSGTTTLATTTITDLTISSSTFSSLPNLSSTPTTANQATRKSYVDGLAASSTKTLYMDPAIHERAVGTGTGLATTTSYAVPAGKMGTNKGIKVTFYGQRHGTNGNFTFGLYFDGQAIGTIVLAGTDHIIGAFEAYIFNISATSQRYLLKAVNNTADALTTGTLSVDTTGAKNLDFTTTPANANDSGDISMVLVELFDY